MKRFKLCAPRWIVATTEAAGADPEQIQHRELYSCFPSAVRVQLRELGIDPMVRLTEIGGYRTYKLSSGTTSEPGRYVKSLGEPVTGAQVGGRGGNGPAREEWGRPRNSPPPSLFPPAQVVGCPLAPVGGCIDRTGCIHSPTCMKHGGKLIDLFFRSCGRASPCLCSGGGGKSRGILFVGRSPRPLCADNIFLLEKPCGDCPSC